MIVILPSQRQMSVCQFAIANQTVCLAGTQRIEESTTTGEDIYRQRPPNSEAAEDLGPPHQVNNGHCVRPYLRGRHEQQPKALRWLHCRIIFRK